MIKTAPTGRLIKIIQSIYIYIYGAYSEKNRLINPKRLADVSMLLPAGSKAAPCIYPKQRQGGRKSSFNSHDAKQWSEIDDY